MRVLDYLFAVVALAGLTAAAWWGIYQSPNNAANLEARLQTKTSSALAESAQNWASVDMDGQLAVLSGQAPSPDAVRDAADVVLTADGPGGLILGGVTQVKSLANAAAPVSPFVWRATKTDTGKLILTGHVPSRATREALLAEAQLLADGGEVVDQMVFASGAPVGNWQGVARLGLRQVAAIETGEARLSDTLLTLRGISMDDAQRAKVSAEIANVTAPFRGEPLIRGASLWTAEHADNELVLSGKVATEAEKTEIFNIARQHYALDVRDDMIVAEADTEGWLDGVRLGLPHFAKFKSGEMGFDPEGEGFTFEGEASGSTLEYLRQDMATLEGPYGATIAVDAVQVDVAEIEGIDFSGNPREACEKAFNSVMDTNSVTFSLGKADISRESGETLDKLMAVSAQCDKALIFELGGHTDDTGDRAANVVLSEARAASVAEYMVSAGFNPARLSAIGYGPDLPVQGNDSPEGRAKNRRIEFKVLERSN